MNNPLIHPMPTLETAEPARRLRFPERVVAGWLDGIRAGRLTVEFPSGATQVFAGREPGPSAALRIRDMRLVPRLMFGGDLGFAESYMAGEWDTPDLSALMTLGVLNENALKAPLASSWLSRLIGRLNHRHRANTRKGSRRNIAAHYDLGNAFYGQWLDRSMTYSSALFDRPDEPLEAAQRRKYIRLAGMLELSSGDRVLEIGCGWGGFAEIAAAEFGCEVVCLTLSTEQAAYTRGRMAQAGLADRVEVRLQDYREVSGTFDKIASVEMFEAVGEAYWPRYMNILRARLKPGGRAALQVITIDDARFASYRREPDFIQRYIFPGGMLPSPGAFARAAGQAGLRIADSLFFGASYAETIRRWDAAFTANWGAIRPHGFDDRFHRLWRYYLAYCEVGFDTGQIDVGHFLLISPCRDRWPAD